MLSASLDDVKVVNNDDPLKEALDVSPLAFNVFVYLPIQVTRLV